MQKFFRLPEITVRILVRPTIGHLLYAVPGVPEMTPEHCFLLALEALKWLSEKHQSSDISVSIFGHRCLCLL